MGELAVLVQYGRLQRCGRPNNEPIGGLPRGNNAAPAHSHGGILTLPEEFLPPADRGQEDLFVAPPNGEHLAAVVDIDVAAIHRTSLERPHTFAELERRRERQPAVGRAHDIHIAVAVQRVSKHHHDLTLPVNRHRRMATFADCPGRCLVDQHVRRPRRATVARHCPVDVRRSFPEVDPRHEDDRTARRHAVQSFPRNTWRLADRHRFAPRLTAIGRTPRHDVPVLPAAFLAGHRGDHDSFTRHCDMRAAMLAKIKCARVGNFDHRSQRSATLHRAGKVHGLSRTKRQRRLAAIWRHLRLAKLRRGRRGCEFNQQEQSEPLHVDTFLVTG